MNRDYLQSIFVAYLVFVVSNFSQLTGGFNFELFCVLMQFPESKL